jgi:hypothetical protein
MTGGKLIHAVVQPTPASFTAQSSHEQEKVLVKILVRSRANSSISSEDMVLVRCQSFKWSSISSVNARARPHDGHLLHDLKITAQLRLTLLHNEEDGP